MPVTKEDGASATGPHAQRSLTGTVEWAAKINGDNAIRFCRSQLEDAADLSSACIVDKDVDPLSQTVHLLKQATDSADETSSRTPTQCQVLAPRAPRAPR